MRTMTLPQSYRNAAILPRRFPTPQRRTGHVHVFGRWLSATVTSARRKMDQSPDFAVLLPLAPRPLTLASRDAIQMYQYRAALRRALLRGALGGLPPMAAAGSPRAPSRPAQWTDPESCVEAAPSHGKWVIQGFCEDRGSRQAGSHSFARGIPNSLISPVSRCRRRYPPMLCDFVSFPKTLVDKPPGRWNFGASPHFQAIRLRESGVAVN